MAGYLAVQGIRLRKKTEPLTASSRHSTYLPHLRICLKDQQENRVLVVTQLSLFLYTIVN
jgi:hypothetical protein